MKRVLVLAGQTAVGKTELALAIAERHNGEIVSLDSRQMYRRLNIGTAKPSAAELQCVKHHLVDCYDPEERPTLSQIQVAAFAAVDAIHARNKLPILIAGTGQYLLAVLEGWTIPRVAPDERLRERLVRISDRFGTDFIRQQLLLVDARSAQNIEPRNLRRMVRALEVLAHTGRPISELQKKEPPPYDFRIVRLSRPREVLYERIDQRIKAMVQAGLEQEIKDLLDSGLNFEITAMQSVGYREWRPYFAERVEQTTDSSSYSNTSPEPEDLETVIAAIKKNTRRLARTQDNWFGRITTDHRIVDLDRDAALSAIESVSEDIEF